MLPVMCSRQVRNGALRAMGVEPRVSYQVRTYAGDLVKLEVATERPRFKLERIEAKVLHVVDHGHYTIVSYRRLDDGTEGTARLFHAGPPDWGVISFVVIRRTRETQPSHWNVGHRGSLRPLSEPQPCPWCKAMCDYIPLGGWPCLACRRRRKES